VKAQFIKQTAFLAVLVQHLADNYVKLDAGQGSKLTSLENLIKKLSRKVDALESKLQESDSKNDYHRS
jgi:hypothetical protein